MQPTEQQRQQYFLIRRKKKISGEKIAKHLGFSQSWLSQLEMGKKEFDGNLWEKYVGYIDQA